jgi:hypothetical protein
MHPSGAPAPREREPMPASVQRGRELMTIVIIAIGRIGDIAALRRSWRTCREHLHG